MFWRKTQRLRDTLDGTKARVEKLAVRFSDELRLAESDTTKVRISRLAWVLHCGRWRWRVATQTKDETMTKYGFKARLRVRKYDICGVCGSCSFK